MAKLTAEQLKHYEKVGYVILENSFFDRETAELMEHIDKLDAEQEEKLKLLGQQGISRPNQINFTAHLVQKDDYIKQFVMQQKFVDVTTSILGPEIKLYWDQSVYKRPEADRDFPWHQDTGYATTEPLHYVTIWLALEDATIENGCIWVMPESHLNGLVEHRKTEIGKQCYFGEDPGIPVPLKRGSMVVFNSLLYHRSTPNISKGTRKGYIIQYSVTGAFHPVTGQVFNNGPVIAEDGKAVKAAQ